MKMKYVIVTDRSDAEFPIIFSTRINHDDVVPKFLEAKRAGFVEIKSLNSNISVECSGMSHSLGIRSNPLIDKNLIEDELNNVK
jgi:hypothetical protein